MRKRILLPALLTVLGSLGCGTFLAVGGAGADCRQPGGLAINQRATFEGTVGGTAIDSKSLNVVSTKARLVTVDPHHVMTVNWRRMPFSSGEVKITLNKEQVLKEITLDSTTGAARAAQAGSAVADAMAEIEKQREAAAGQ